MAGSHAKSTLMTFCQHITRRTIESGEKHLSDNSFDDFVHRLYVVRKHRSLYGLECSTPNKVASTLCLTGMPHPTYTWTS